MFAFLMAVKQDYDISKKEIRKFNKIGAQGLNTLLAELKEQGYITENGSHLILDNGNHSRVQSVARTVEKAKRPTKTKRDWTDQRILERRDFVRLVQDAVGKMKPAIPSEQLVRDFLRYWASIDSIDPSKKMMFQTKQTFNIPSRIRTFMRLEQQRNKEQKKQDRL